ncbi:MAG: DUF4089 domain-containing protein [Chitinophagaceae bacterium]|nr:DUF4089 domain-containing protein [Rubrivivax sp.]
MANADLPLSAAQIGAAVDAQAAVLGLVLAPEHRPGVMQYYALAARMAALVQGLPLGRDDESAAVFTPVGPRTAQ